MVRRSSRHLTALRRSNSSIASSCDACVRGHSWPILQMPKRPIEGIGGAESKQFSSFRSAPVSGGMSFAHATGIFIFCTFPYSACQSNPVQ